LRKQFGWFQTTAVVWLAYTWRLLLLQEYEGKLIPLKQAASDSVSKVMAIRIVHVGL